MTLQILLLFEEKHLLTCPVLSNVLAVAPPLLSPLLLLLLLYGMNALLLCGATAAECSTTVLHAAVLSHALSLSTWE
jgi:hypothetical protein